MSVLKLLKGLFAPAPPKPAPLHRRTDDFLERLRLDREIRANEKAAHIERRAERRKRADALLKLIKKEKESRFLKWGKRLFDRVTGEAVNPVRRAKNKMMRIYGMSGRQFRIYRKKLRQQTGVGFEVHIGRLAKMRKAA